MEEMGRDRGSERAMKKLGLRTGSLVLGTDWEMIGQGAEAKIFRGTFDGQCAVAKQRFAKGYRHPSLDVQLSRERMRAEARSNIKCRAAGIAAPQILLVDIEQRVIVMEEVAGGASLKLRVKQLEKQLGPEADSELQHLATSLGQLVGKLHEVGVVHGDLTTSNILLKEDGSMVLIDFGLSGSDVTAEDMAVDLYVLERALASSHPNLEPLLPFVLAAYKESRTVKGKAVLTKLEEVRLRGRKRSMVG